MVRRIVRSATVLGVLIAAYATYVTLAVPLMEPPLKLRARGTTPSQADLIPTVTKYQRLLRAYFPADHWSQTQPPKVIGNSDERALLVFDEFKRRPGSGQNADGSPTTFVDIERIAFLMFPTPPREGITPPPDAIILEAPQGAHLEFNEFRPEVGKIGQIIRGDFPGPIRIRSDMKDPTPNDDLLIETADLQMNTKLMYTSAPVRFRMGENVGGGNELEIRFLADEHLKPGDPGLKIAGIDTLEIRRDVRMRVQMEVGGLLPGGKKDGPKTAQDKHGKDGEPASSTPTVQVTDANKAPEPIAAAKPKTPVDVSCTGPFTFDFVRYVASLDHDVELRQINLNGPSDQLMCSRLDIHFAPKEPPAGVAAPVAVDPSKRQQHDLGNLEAVAIVAEGHPVVLTSPSRNAQARGERIQIALRDQRVRISGGSDAFLMYGTNVLKAPIIDYQHPAKDEGTQIGRFRASGPGTLHYVVDATKPQEVLQAAWQTSVQLGRDKGQPVLALEGRPKVAFAETGSLTADQIRMYLRELEGQGKEGFAVRGNGGATENQLRLAPDRMLATGHVEIASPAFTGHVQSLSASFKLKPVEAQAATGATGNKNAAPGAPNAADGNPTAPNAAPAAPPQQRYYIDADQLQLDVSITGQKAAPTSLACDGHVLLREVPLVATSQQPLEVRGGQLQIDHLDTNAPHVTLHGVAPGQAPGSALAQVAGRGMTMLVDTIEFDGGTNRMWSDGPGKATMLVTGGMAGNPLGPNTTANPNAVPVPMELTWQGGLKFDGQTIHFQRDVLVVGMESKLHCEELLAKLSAPVQFGQHIEQASMTLNEIECRGGVKLENITRDEQGVTSHSQMEDLDRLTINQQTGQIMGYGSGIIRSTRFGATMTALDAPPGTTPATPLPANAAGSKLYFLRVDFHNGLSGNMYTRELTFQERVRTVYGPVDTWEQELDPLRPETLPPDAITMNCDQLRLNEDPVAARAVAAQSGGQRPAGPIQMLATGDVRITGQVPKQGEFSVQANQASYDHLKETFILEGDGRTPAKLWRRNAAGVDVPPTEARKIRYVRSTGDIQVDGIQYFEITPNDIQNARRPTPPTK